MSDNAVILISLAGTAYTVAVFLWGFVVGYNQKDD